MTTECPKCEIRHCWALVPMQKRLIHCTKLHYTTIKTNRETGSTYGGVRKTTPKTIFSSLFDTDMACSNGLFVLIEDGSGFALSDELFGHFLEPELRQPHPIPLKTLNHTNREHANFLRNWGWANSQEIQRTCKFPEKLPKLSLIQMW